METFNCAFIFSGHPLNLEYLYRIMASYFHLRNLDSTYAWAVKYEALEVKINGNPKPDCYKGYIYQIRGMKAEAEWNIEGTIQECNDQVKNNNRFAQERWVYGLLSAMFILQGEKEKALAYFKLMTLRKTFGLLVLIQVKVWPIYDAIREEPEFKKMLKEMEYKYLSEHEKVKELLISRGIDPA